MFDIRPGINRKAELRLIASSNARSICGFSLPAFPGGAGKNRHLREKALGFVSPLLLLLLEQQDSLPSPPPSFPSGFCTFPDRRGNARAQEERYSSRGRAWNSCPKVPRALVESPGAAGAGAAAAAAAPCEAQSGSSYPARLLANQLPPQPRAFPASATPRFQGRPPRRELDF